MCWLVGPLLVAARPRTARHFHEALPLFDVPALFRIDTGPGQTRVLRVVRVLRDVVRVARRRAHAVVAVAAFEGVGARGAAAANGADDCTRQRPRLARRTARQVGRLGRRLTCVRDTAVRHARGMRCTPLKSSLECTKCTPHAYTPYLYAHVHRSRHILMNMTHPYEHGTSL